MKREVELYFFAVLLLGVVFLLMFFQVGLTGTGFAILEDYTDETSCVDAGYAWENLTEESCTDIPDCTECAEGCLTEGDICEEGCLTEYSEVLCAEGCSETCEEGDEECVVCELDCVEEYTETLCAEDCVSEEEICVEGCSETCQDCVDEVVGGQCVGDVCDSDNLNLCLTSEDCGVAEGYWYDSNEDGNSTCNSGEEPSCSNDLSLCDETNCNDVGSGYWYDTSCNENECGSDAHCSSGYECQSGSCTLVEEEEEEEDTLSEAEEETEEEVYESSPPAVSVPVPQTISKLDVNTIAPISLKNGELGDFSLVAINSGTKPLSSCTMGSSGELEWVFLSDGSGNLNPGDEKTFTFRVEVFESIEAGSYSTQLSVNCYEISASTSLTINVIRETFEFNITEVRKIRNNKVRATYTLTDLLGEDQVIELRFALFDNESIKVSELSSSINLTSNSIEEFDSVLDVNESVEGNLTIQADINSQTYSSSVNEAIVLSAPPLLGFAVFDQIGGTGGLIVLVISIIAIVAIILLSRKLRRKRKLITKK